jgi:hypothetical protein
LVSFANHKESEYIFRGKTHVLKRGQLKIVVSELSDFFGIKPSKATRILNIFEKDGRIEKRGNNKFTIITVTNYDQYQNMENQRKTSEKPAKNQRKTSEKPAESAIILKNEKNVKNEKNINNNTSKTLAQARLQKFEIFWDTFDYKKGRGGAEKSWHKLGNIDEFLFAKILRGAEAEARGRPLIISKGLTPKMAQGWITDKRWEDEVNTIQQSQNGSLSIENQRRREVENSRLKQEREENAQAIAEQEARQKKIDALDKKGLIGLDAFIESQGNRFIKPGTTLGRHRYIDEYYKTIRQ